MSKWSSLRNSIYNNSYCWIISALQKILGASWNDIWASKCLSFSLPEWKAVKMTFFAPWIHCLILHKKIDWYYELNISASYQSPKYSFRCCNNGCCPTINKFTSFFNLLTKQTTCCHAHSKNYLNTLECCTLMPVHQSYLSHCKLLPNEKS